MVFLYDCEYGAKQKQSTVSSTRSPRSYEMQNLKPLLFPIALRHGSVQLTLCRKETVGLKHFTGFNIQVRATTSIRKIGVHKRLTVFTITPAFFDACLFITLLRSSPGSSMPTRSVFSRRAFVPDGRESSAEYSRPRTDGSSPFVVPFSSAKLPGDSQSKRTK